MRQVELRLHREEAISAQRRLSEQRARELEEQWKQVQEFFMDQKRREERMVQMREEARIQKQRYKALTNNEPKLTSGEKRKELRSGRMRPRERPRESW